MSRAMIQLKDRRISAASLARSLCALGYKIVVHASKLSAHDSPPDQAVTAGPMMDVVFDEDLPPEEAFESVRKCLGLSGLSMVEYEDDVLDGVRAVPVPECCIIKPFTASELKKVLCLAAFDDQTSATLDRMELTLRMLFEIAPVAYQSLDGKGGILEVNQAWKELTGYEDDETLVGKSFSEFLGEHSTESFEQGLADLLQKGCVRDLELDLIKADGSVARVVWNAKLTSSAVRTLDVIHDVTRFRNESPAPNDTAVSDLGDRVPQIIFQTDSKGFITFLNRGGMNYLGLTKEDISKGTHFIELMRSEDRTMALEHFARRIHGEASSGAEYILVSRDGKTIPVVAYSDPVTRDGSFEGVVGIAVDVGFFKKAQAGREESICQLKRRLQTHRFQLEQEVGRRESAEKARKESELMFRSIFECLSDCVFVLTPECAISQINPAAKRLFGFDEHEMLGRYPAFLEMDGRQSGLADKIAESRASGNPVIFETVNKRKNGEVFPSENTLSILKNNGDNLGLLLVVRDISHRKSAEEKLRLNEQRFTAIIDSTPDCIYVKDSEQRYTHVNPAMEKLIGLPKSQILGKKLEDCFKEGFATITGKTREPIHEVFEKRQTIPVRGVPTTFHVVKIPLFDKDGRVSEVCGIARDVTEITRAGELSFSRGIPKTSGEVKYYSPAMKSFLDLVTRASQSDSIVLLSGESGSGKDYWSRIIHESSKRAGGPYFVINCAAVAGQIAESELFGHEAGSFTGAVKQKKGLLELAHGGTLFLNEIGELSPENQAKLLTFLDTRAFTRIGGEKSIPVDARLIAATNKDLDMEVALGRFRRDLYFRLNVLFLKVPALLERTSDIPVLVKEILASLATKMNMNVPAIDDQAMELIKNYNWPGNVRELRNVLERALILSEGRAITARCLGIEISDREWSINISFPANLSLNDIAEDVKRRLVFEALRRAKGNKTRAGGLLGISRHSVLHYVKTLGV